MKTPIKDYVAELLGIVARMQADYSKKKFTLDGRLVGDIGEILAEQIYDLDLLEGLCKTHDAVSQGRNVQIKTTMKHSLGFGDIPDYYIGIRISETGEVEEVFNGPGSIIWQAIKHRTRPRNFLFNVDLSILRRLNATVAPEDRIKKRVSIDK